MGRRLALLIATYEYEDAGLRKLVSPPHDAEAFAAVLGDPEIAGFEVTTLINESHGTVGRAISDLYRDRLGDDLTLLYYTGHGLKDDDGQLYLAMADTQRDNLDFTGLSTERIGRVLSRCSSRQKVLILDCCYSGAYQVDLTKSDAGVHTMDRFRGRGLTVLTASDAMQYSFEGDKVHGAASPSVFTGHMVAGIRDGSADLDGDGDITLGELYDYVYDRVVAETPHQRPKKKDDTEGRTVLARNVHWRLPDHLVNAISSPLASARFDALNWLDRLSRTGNEVVRARVLTELLRLADDDSRKVSTAAASRLPLPPDQATATAGGGPSTAVPGSLAADRARAAEIVRRAHAEAQSIIARAKAQVDAVLVDASASAKAFLETSRRDVETLRDRVRTEVERGRRELADAEQRRDTALAEANGAEALRDTALAEAQDAETRRDAALNAAGAAETRRDTALAEVDAAREHGGLAQPKDQPDSAVEVVRSLAGHSKAVHSAAFHPQGHILATASEDHSVRLWNPYTGTLLRLLDHVIPVYAVAFHPSRDLLATGSHDYKVRLWDSRNGKRVGELHGHTDFVDALAFHPAGHLLASGSRDGTARLWDPQTGESVGDPLAGHERTVTAVAFHPEGHLLATGGRDRRVRFWDPTTGLPVGSALSGHAGPVRAIAYHPGLRLLASAGEEGTVRLWDLRTNRLASRPLTGHAGAVHSVAFHPDGHLLATAGYDCTVRLWEPHTGQQVGAPLVGHTSPVRAVAFHPDGQLLVSGSATGAVRLWSGVSLLGRQVPQPVAAPPPRIGPATVHPDPSPAGTVPDPVRPASLQPDPGKPAAFRPDPGKKVAEARASLAQRLLFEVPLSRAGRRHIRPMDYVLADYVDQLVTELITLTDPREVSATIRKRRAAGLPLATLEPAKPRLNTLQVLKQDGYVRQWVHHYLDGVEEAAEALAQLLHKPQ